MRRDDHKNLWTILAALILGAFFMGMPTLAHASGGERQSSADYLDADPEIATTVSSLSYTAIPATSSVKSGRFGTLVFLPASEVSALDIKITTSTTGPNVNDSNGIDRVLPGDPPRLFSLGPNTYLFARSTGPLSTHKVVTQDLK